MYQSAETYVLLEAMDPRPAHWRVHVEDRFISALKQAGVWTKLGVLYVLATHASQPARLNWKDPANYALSLIGSPTFTVDEGYRTASSSVLDTGLSPGAIPGLIAGSSHIGAAIIGYETADKPAIGGESGTRVMSVTLMHL